MTDSLINLKYEFSLIELHNKFIYRRGQRFQMRFCEIDIRARCQSSLFVNLPGITGIKNNRRRRIIFAH